MQLSESQSLGSIGMTSSVGGLDQPLGVAPLRPLHHGRVWERAAPGPAGHWVWGVRVASMWEPRAPNTFLVSEGQHV